MVLVIRYEKVVYSSFWIGEGRERRWISVCCLYRLLDLRDSSCL